MRRNRRSVISAVLLGAVLVAVSTPAHAATPTGITVRGVGSANVTPDAVRVSLNMTALAATTSEAQSIAAKKSAVVRAHLTGAGVKSADIATSRLSVQPEYSYANNQPEIIGQRATQSFTVTIRSVSRAGAIIDDVTSSTGEGLSIDAATPIVLDDEAATQRARTAAVKNAKSKAASYAKMLGVRLGSVQSLVEIETGGSYPSYPIMGKAEDAVSTQIDPGTQKVTLTVEIRWSLRN